MADPPSPAAQPTTQFDPLAELAGVPADAGTGAGAGTALAPSPASPAKPLHGMDGSAATFDAPTASRVAHVKAVMGGGPQSAPPQPHQSYAQTGQGYQNNHAAQNFHYHAHLQQQQQRQQQQQQQQQLIAYGQAMQAQQLHAYQTAVAQQHYMSTLPGGAAQSHALVVHGQYNHGHGHNHGQAYNHGYGGGGGNAAAFAAQQQQMLQLQLQQRAAMQSSALVPAMQADAAAAPQASDYRVQRRKPTLVSDDDCAFRPLVDLLKDRIKTAPGATPQSQSRAP